MDMSDMYDMIRHDMINIFYSLYMITSMNNYSLLVGKLNLANMHVCETSVLEYA